MKVENDTLKRIKSNGKVGLVHTNGRIILEPKYTNVLIDESGILFFENGLHGYLPNGAGKAIPANYKKIDRVYSFFTAFTENGTMDLYRGTELIASDLDPWLSEMDVLLETGLIIVRKDDKTGIVNEKGEVVVPIEYSVVERLSSFKYDLPGKTSVDYILVLDQTDYFYSPESEGSLPFGESKHYLAKADGSLITDSVFSMFWPVNPKTNTIELRYGKKIATLLSDFRVEYSRYESEEEFLEWKFCATGNEEIIFNRFGVAIDSFAEVQIPNKLSWIQNDADLEKTYYNETLFEDFVYVTKMDGEDYRTAIYDLKSERLVSNWEKSITYWGKGTHPSGTTVWIFKDETEKLAFSISATGKSSPFEYQDIYHAGTQFYAFRKEGETTYGLYELVGDSVFVERIQIEKSFGSYNYVGMSTMSIQETDPQLLGGFTDDFGNYYTYKFRKLHEDPPFKVPLTLFKNANGKLGFISWNGKVVDLQADTLFQSKLFGTMIEYRVGDLWGAADIAWGSVFKPDRPASGSFYIIDGLALIYRLSEDEKHYIDSKGRIFYSVNPERTVSTKGKFKGSEMHSDFEDDKQTVVIPYSYSEILPTWDEIHFLAKGSTKKWGVISAFGDTLFDFRYDELRFGVSKENPVSFEFPYRDYDEQCFTRIGEFHGILSLNLRKEIPAAYDWVQYVPNAAFIVKKGEKFGVYDYNLNEKIKPVFDEVFIASSKAGVYILRAKKGAKWYNLEFFEGKVPDQTVFLQAPAFDLVINETGFVKTETGYEARDLNNVLLKKEAVLSDYLDENQFKLSDGKIFLLDLKGKPLYREGLTNIVILEDGRVISVENGIRYVYTPLKKNRTIFTE